MKKFRVELYELYSTTYEFEAESLVEACNMAGNYSEEVGSVFLETAENYGMSADHIPEELVDQFIEEGLLKEDGFVAGIRSVVEVTE